MSSDMLQLALRAKVDNQMSDCTGFDLGGDKSTIPMPSLPVWMLDTPMYSKLPMVPAPKGRIVLFTTGLCKKLHQTPDDLDFDPVAAGVCSEYKSLHDPHLRSHYTTAATIRRLIKSGFITPDGMVKCTLKEFNDYHQYLKSVRLEKLTQERKRMMALEKERYVCDHREVSERDKLIKKSLIRQKKVLNAERAKLARKLQHDCRKTMMRLLERRRLKTTLQQHRRQRNEEKHHSKKMNLEVEDKTKKAMILAKHKKEEAKCTDMLNYRRRQEKADRERKLKDHWIRHGIARAKRLIDESKTEARKMIEMNQKVEMREQKVARHREKQQVTFTKIRDERCKTLEDREATIANRLEKKLASVCRKYTVGPKRIHRRFPPINPRLMTNMTLWTARQPRSQQQQQQPQGALPPIIEPDGAAQNRKRLGPPTVARYKKFLPNVRSSESSLAMGDATSTNADDVGDPFSVLAKQLVSTVLGELRLDEEFASVDWDEEGKDDIEAAAVESSSSQDMYVEAHDVSRHASLLVASAMKNAVAQLCSTGEFVEKKEVTIVNRAEAIVSRAVKNALTRLQSNESTNAADQSECMIKMDDVREMPSNVYGMSSLESDIGASLNRGSVLLSSIIDIFKEPPSDGPLAASYAPGAEDSESDDEEFEMNAETVIGIVENAAILSDGGQCCGDKVDSVASEGLVEVVRQTNDNRLIVEGAILSSSSHSHGPSRNPSVTERVLSSNILHVGSSGHLSDSAQASIPLEEDTDSSSDSENDAVGVLPKSKASSIVPIFQQNTIDVGGGLIEKNLAAISQKPESSGGLLPRGKCGARNSFRNIFQPDMTYCQGSAKTLRDTLVREIASRHTRSEPRGMDQVYEVLEREEQDIMEKHSDEELVTMQETEGICYLPPRRNVRTSSTTTPSHPAASSTTSATSGATGIVPSITITPVEEQKDVNGKTVDGDTDKPDPQKPDQSESDETKPSVDTVVESPSTELTTDQAAETTEDPKADRVAVETITVLGADEAAEITPSSKSATETGEGAFPAVRLNSQCQVSAQSVDSSANLAMGGDKRSSTANSNSAEGADDSSKKKRKRAKKVTRSSSLISNVMSRLSRVFSSPRGQSYTSCHESSSEPASRQASKNSVESNRKVKTGTASIAVSPEGHKMNGNSESLHHDFSVHFATLTQDPPDRAESIYATVRPQTPLPTASSTNSHDNECADDEREIGVSVLAPSTGDDNDDKAERSESTFQKTSFILDTPSGNIANRLEGADALISASATSLREPAENNNHVTSTAGESGQHVEVPHPPADSRPFSSRPDAEKSKMLLETADASRPLKEHTEENSSGLKVPADSRSDNPVMDALPAQPKIEDVASNDSNNANTNGATGDDVSVLGETNESIPCQLPSIHVGQTQDVMSSTSESSNRSNLPASESLTITGRALTPSASKGRQSVSSTKSRQKPWSSKHPSGHRVTNIRSKNKRVASAKKRASSSSQSASKVVSVYGGSHNHSPSGLSITGSQLIPAKSQRSFSSRRVSRTRAAPISATNIAATGHGFNQRSQSSSRTGVVMPHPPSGAKPISGSLSNHRTLNHAVGSQGSGTKSNSNPAMDAVKKCSIVTVNERIPDRLLPRRPSMEKENKLERLSTESVASRRSSQGRIVKKKSSSSQLHSDEASPEGKSTAPMPPLKESITPRPPSRPGAARERSRPGSVSIVPHEKTADSSHEVPGDYQATPHD